MKIGQVAEEESAQVQQQNGRARRPQPCRIPHAEVPDLIPKDWQHTDDRFSLVEIMDPDEALSQNIIRLMLRRFARDKQRQDFLDKRSTKNSNKMITSDDTVNQLN